MKPTPLSSSIDDVTVFRRGAIVRRQVEISAGVTKGRVLGLPLSLVDSTLRVRAEGTMASEAVVVLALGNDDAAETPARDTELRAAMEAERIAKARIAAVDRIVQDLQTLSIKPRGRAEGEVPVAIPSAARSKLIDFRRAQLEQRREERAALTEALRLAVEERKDLQEKRKRAGNAVAARENEVRKAVDLSLDGNAGTVWLEYMVPTASWRPSYVLRLEEGLRKVRLETRALIAQHSGEDWNEARLRLSTAIPQAHAELPVLRSLRIGRRQPAPATKGYRPPPSGVDMLFQDYDQGFRPAPKPARPPAKPVAMPMSAPAPAAPPPPPQAPPGFGGAAPVGAPMIEAAEELAAPAPRSMARGRRMKKKSAAPRALSAKLDVRASRSEPEGAMEDTMLGGMDGMDSMSAEGPLRPGDEWLQFGNLRMPAASDPGRGKLRRERREAKAAGSHSLTAEPPGHVLPRPVEGFDYSFEVEGNATIPSDGSWVGASLSVADAKGTPRFVCVPRESREVFRFIDIANPLEAPLLAGPLDIYIDGRFLLARAMPVVGPGETLKLGLGVEQRIKVARNVQFEESVAGMLRGSLELEHHLEVEVVSYIDTDALLEVRERIPVLREDEDDIEVRVVKCEPRWSPYKNKDDTLRGGYEWKIPLARGEKHVLGASYTIKISSKNELAGGNRRDA
ncbi:MAG: mucoidy inhibitor MuiA family protein [Polyangiales bacterium]